jgi:small subunit ribosomal protein S6
MSQVQLPPGHAREYETVYILRPNLAREHADDVAAKVRDAVRGHDGVIAQTELWGRRRLAYPIQNHHRGLYVYLKYLGRGATVSEVERQLRLSDHVIRWQTVQTRPDVAVADLAVDEAALKLDFELPEEPDEPEFTRERELGLDQPFDERGPRRRDRRDRDDLGDDEDVEGMGDDADLDDDDGGEEVKK